LHRLLYRQQQNYRHRTSSLHIARSTCKQGRLTTSANLVIYSTHSTAARYRQSRKGTCYLYFIETNHHRVVDRRRAAPWRYCNERPRHGTIKPLWYIRSTRRDLNATSETNLADPSLWPSRSCSWRIYRCLQSHTIVAKHFYNKQIRQDRSTWHASPCWKSDKRWCCQQMREEGEWWWWVSSRVCQRYGYLCGGKHDLLSECSCTWAYYEFNSSIGAVAVASGSASSRCSTPCKHGRMSSNGWPCRTANSLDVGFQGHNRRVSSFKICV